MINNLALDRRECEECAIERNLGIESQLCGIPQSTLGMMGQPDNECVRCGHNLECHSPAPTNPLQMIVRR